jgi:hypothetical protein
MIRPRDMLSHEAFALWRCLAMSTKRTCNASHPFIASGLCPWCGQAVREGDVSPDSKDLAIERRWNHGLIGKALTGEGAQTCLASITKDALHGSELQGLLPVLAKAATSCAPKIRWLASAILGVQGGRLFGEDAEWLEQQVTSDPTNLACRILLLGYYFLRSRLSESDRRLRHKHLLWIIENEPCAPIAGDAHCSLTPDEDPAILAQARQFWHAHVALHGAEPAVLGNAADFFTLLDVKLSQELTKKAQVLEPDNPKWAERLAQLYSLEMLHSSESPSDLARTALAELEAALSKGLSEFQRKLMLPGVAKAALAAGEFEKARGYANELLAVGTDTRLASPMGEAVHVGNLVLGELALRADDVEQAKTYLIAAGKTVGSPALKSFGPNMRLAKQLLDRGERAVVIDYLKVCANFWQTNNHRAEQWIHLLEHGGSPDFGANLVY